MRVTHCAGMPAPHIHNVTRFLEAGCAARLSSRQAYETQTLFTVYVHRKPGAEGAGPESMFHGRDIPERCVHSLQRPAGMPLVFLQDTFEPCDKTRAHGFTKHLCKCIVAW